MINEINFITIINDMQEKIEKKSKGAAERSGSVQYDLEFTDK